MTDTPQPGAGSASGADQEHRCVLTVANKMGIHARPAAMVVRVASRFEGEVWVEKDDEQVNGKSIMGIMMLAAGPGSKLTVIAKGADPTELFRELEELFARKFEEA